MMLVPRKNEFDLFDNFFDDGFFTKRERNMMKTDIREQKDKYIVDIDLPGFEKENINVSLDKGYLNISAKVDKKEENKEHEKYVHRERFIGECSRSFYLGEDVKEENIRAEFKNGILKIEVPKKEAQEKLNEPKHIEIE